jgi:hypothetical protein
MNAKSAHERIHVIPYTAGAAKAADEGLANHPDDDGLWQMRIRAALALGDGVHRQPRCRHRHGEGRVRARDADEEPLRVHAHLGGKADQAPGPAAVGSRGHDVDRAGERLGQGGMGEDAIAQGGVRDTSQHRDLQHGHQLAPLDG